jgi:hypothetical protein
MQPLFQIQIPGGLSHFFLKTLNFRVQFLDGTIFRVSSATAGTS